MKTIAYTQAGSTWHLCLNGAALFDIYDKFGTEQGILEHIEGVDRKSYDAVCWMLAKLAEQGEIVRRYQGLEHGKFPSEHYFRANLRPTDVLDAKQAIRDAVRLGFSREEADEDEVIDLGLMKLQKKTALD